MESSNTIPLTMKAAQWRTIRGGIERNLKFSVDAKLPKDSHSLANGHTLVKVAYASVNHLDYKVAEMPLASLKINPSLYWQSHNYLKPHGSYICVGLPSIFQFIKTFLSIKLLPRWLGGGKRTFKFQEEKVKVVVEEGFVLEDADRAYASLKGGRTRGKIVVRIGGEPDGEQ
ncbi:hypothetical protein NXS19_007168 [Fusarium pseudograminearum]|nr:hypothetical protein NXS19_007168 [Fusarium pseudograminearum]